MRITLGISGVAQAAKYIEVKPIKLPRVPRPFNAFVRLPYLLFSDFDFNHAASIRFLTIYTSKG